MADELQPLKERFESLEKRVVEHFEKLGEPIENDFKFFKTHVLDLLEESETSVRKTIEGLEARIKELETKIITHPTE